MWIEDVQELLYPIRNNFTVYEKFPIDGSKNATWTLFNQTARIPEAGVYSTYFLFGQSLGSDNDTDNQD